MQYPILAADSSAAATSVALWNGARMFTRCTAEPHKHAECLVPFCGEVLAEAGLAPAALKAYAVTLGPGSFTGIRIALSAFVGMRTVHRLPLYGLNTLEVAAFEGGLAETGGAVVREALRGQAYMQRFEKGLVASGPVALLDYAEITPALQGHSVLSNCAAIPGKPLPEITAEAILRLLLARPMAPLAEAEIKPLYIRPPDAKLPSKAGA